MESALSHIRMRWTLLAAALLVASAGCSQSKSCLQNCAASCPRIDPTGQALLVAPTPKPTLLPGRITHMHDTSVLVSPSRVIAPVGTEVVVLAGVCGQKGTLKPNERVEWMLAPGGVGHFVDVGRGVHDHLHKLVGLGPKKVDNTLALGKTTSKLTTLTRGTPEPGDDVTVQPGQSWITVTSPIEGTSHVTAYAPDVYGWDTRKQTSLIYWVDAQWVFPPPAINPAGTRHAFTTVVTRQSDNAPQVGWSVRYEILDGPEAGFVPNGAKVVEVPTNDLGQAIVEIFQTQPMAGTNNISIQVIRPAELGSGRLVLGTGTTHKTWTSGNISLRMTGPSQAAVGGTLNYHIEITNPGDLSLRDVVVTDQLPAGLSFINSNPAAVDQAGRIEWRLGNLPARTARGIDFNVQANRPGTFNNCAGAMSGESMAAQSCVSTTVLPSGVAGPATSPPPVGQLDVQLTGPAQAGVGEEITFNLTITNRGNAPATGLTLRDTFDGGLQHAVATSPIERDLQDLAPGASARVAVKFRVTQPGQLCNEVEVRSAGGLTGRGRACVIATADGAPAANPGGSQPAISVRKTGPTTKNVGETAEFTITITNTGSLPLSQLKISDNYDRTLEPDSLTDGYRFIGDDIEWVIDELPPGRAVVLEINCKCLLPAARACNRVTVTTREGARADHEACLEIRAAGAGAAAGPAAGANTATSGNLELKIADLRDQVGVGNEVTYEVQVRNTGTTADQQVVVSITASAELTPVLSGSGGPSRFTIEGQTIKFLPFAEIRPGESIPYQVRMRANRAGTARVRAQLQSRGSPRPITAEESTTIFAAS